MHNIEMCLYLLINFFNRISVRSFSSIKCEDVKYRSVIYTFTVAFSAIASLICVFCAFTYFRILGWMLHVSLITTNEFSLVTLEYSICRSKTSWIIFKYVTAIIGDRNMGTGKPS